MPTPQQIKLIQIARRQVDLDEGRYRTLLRSVAGVDSCKLLDNFGVEDVMAVMETMGFRTLNESGDYWRMKVQKRGTNCGERMAAKIHALAEQTKYPAAGMAKRMSHGRTRTVADLSPAEAWEVIEAYKKIVTRLTPAASRGPALFPPLSHKGNHE